MAVLEPAGMLAPACTAAFGASAEVRRLGNAARNTAALSRAEHHSKLEHS